MDSFYRPAWAEISLDALHSNIVGFRCALPEHVSIMAVVKANAYGHGAVEIAREAVACGAEYLGVAFLDEAIELRHAGIDDPILVLGYTPPEGLPLALEHRITINVYDDNVLDALAGIASEAAPASIHIKIDTGMGRIGLYREQDAIAFIEKALRLPGVVVEGLFTHYACADETDKSFTIEQYRRFERIISHFRGQGVSFPYVHAGNSATAIDIPELTCNMVRLGISMYGLYPSAEVNRQRVDLQPVMSFKTGIVMLKTLPAGTPISYGAEYRTTVDGEKIATLPVGYADGFSRALTGRAEAIVHGRKVPIVGRICMDQCMMNVTGVPDINQGDEVVLIGRQGGVEITAEHIADKLGTINYEITTRISHRVPRVYVRGGQRLHTVNPLLV